VVRQKTEGNNPASLSVSWRIAARIRRTYNVVIITTINSRELIKQLEADGWILARVKGSHHQFKHPVKLGLVTVKHPDSDIPAGTLHNIRKQAGWK
jgi:predicted RNA binding protein YcfA (HicA-like mRNA interferase family)